MDFAALRAKGVVPIASFRARLPGWRLRFNVEHFFCHEGGVGNIERTNNPCDAVLGVIHLCENADLAALDKLEGFGIGYDRITVDVLTETGNASAQTYVGLPAYICDTDLPTARYRNILVRGARSVGLDPDYVERLETMTVMPKQSHPPFAAPKEALLMDHTQLEHHQTVLAGHVFCMKDVRFAHELARDWFGGKEVTQFHLRRMDTSTGNEMLHEFLSDDLHRDQRDFLNTYLHAFAEEYRHIAKFNYAGCPEQMILS